MSHPHKPRADSVLKTLPEDRQSAIAQYARLHTLEQTLKWLHANGTHTNIASLSRFLDWHRMKAQMSRDKLVVQQLLSDLANQNPELTPDRLQQLGQIFFLGLALTEQDPRLWCMTQRAGLSKARFDLAMQKYNDERKTAALTMALRRPSPETVTTTENEPS